ncbi:MAG: tetraacyldisaccharide 4'-kinase, partial [Alphaproteobacteria bacterium]
MNLRALAYRCGWLKSVRPRCSVISVGNLTVGGTGKTPVTIFLAKALQERGRRVAVVSRGYHGSLEGETAVVADGENVLLSTEQAGDEPVLIARRLPGVPVVIGARRPAAVALAQQRFGAEVVVCDDAFSHLALQREVDIVLVHGRDGLGNGRCTPAGPLREPPAALRRAQVVALNVTAGEDERTEAEIRRAGYTGPILRFRYSGLAWRRLTLCEELDPAGLSDHRVLAFAATARPNDVFASFAGSGLEVIERVAYPDHHAYTERDLASLAQLAGQKGICYLATTEKDAVKLPFSLPENVEILVASVQLEGLEGALERLVQLVEESR